ncbi:MAG: DegT/DnrJ/EryC1/StrS family aminotransferase [Chloroflexota bacterium]
MSKFDRIYLSPPHMSGRELNYIQDAFDSNWIAPVGPNLTAFENEFCNMIGSSNAVALTSGTAAIHLALASIGVGRGDEVIVSDLTFCASVNPIIYLGAKPIFVDSELVSWNMAPELLENVLKFRAKQGNIPKALVLVHLYGQCADLDTIQGICEHYGVILIEDAAEALGADYKGRSPGTLGTAGIFSFNGNKIITTSGGGMLVSEDKDLVDHARKLSTQARDNFPYYEHSEIGYNYRMSNVLAGIGRGQLEVLEERVLARRHNTDYYVKALNHLPGIKFMPEAPWGRHNRWLTVITIDPKEFGVNREFVRLRLDGENIESRPVWKPMHMQPVYAEYEFVDGDVAELLFKRGLCLPSGSNLTTDDLDRIVSTIKACHNETISLAKPELAS